MLVKLSGKSQVILYVRDMVKEVWFYRDVLGLAIHYPQGLTNYSDEMWVEFALGENALALHGGAKSEPDDSHEIVFWVEDINTAWKKVLSTGIQMGEIRSLEDGALIVEGLDPDGHRFAIRS